MATKFTEDPALDELNELIHSSSALDAAAAQALEHELLGNPASPKILAQLLGYYISQHFKEEHEHKRVYEIAFWFMKRYPRSSRIVSHLYPLFYDVYEGSYAIEAEELWDLHLAQNPNDTSIHWNARAFYALNGERELEIVARLVELDPDESLFLCTKLSSDLKGLHHLKSDARKLAARAALNYWQGFEAAVRAEYHDKRIPMLPLTNASRCALYAGELDIAHSLAQEVLTISPWPFFEDSTAIEHQEAHTLIGLIALARGDVQSAVRSLEEAGMLRFTRALPWMHPNLELAEELLRLGESEAVCKYLENYPNAVAARHRPIVEVIAGIRAGKITSLKNGISYAGLESRRGAYLAKNGRIERAKKKLQDAREFAEQTGHDQFCLAQIEASLGEAERAIKALTQSVKLDPTLRAKVNVEDFESIKDDPRFLSLLES